MASPRTTASRSERRERREQRRARSRARDEDHAEKAASDAAASAGDAADASAKRGAGGGEGPAGKPAESPEAGPKRRDPVPPIVELREATVVYPGGQVALDRVSLTVKRGEFLFIVGPTGCGKSTLIKLLIRDLEPAAGQVRIAGRDIAHLSHNRVPKLRRRIGTVFQDFKLLPNRTVYDNVAYALQVIGEPRSQIRRKVPEVLRLVGLQTKLHSYPDELSGGEQQRASVARAFVNHPPLLLADEPTGNLDPETSIGIMQLLYRINKTGTTVVVVTHDRDLVDKMRRRVIALEEGRLVRDVTAGGYHDESTTEFAARVRTELGDDGAQIRE